MSLPVALGCLWLVVANVIAMFPSKHSHWPAAYVLIALGLPLIAWIALTNPWWMAAIFAIAGASVLRWPVRYLWRWLRRQVLRQEVGH